MDIIEKIGDTLTAKSKEVSDKAKDVAEIANLRGQIRTCEEVIRKNYLEIGKQFMAEYGDSEDAPYAKERTAIRNAQRGAAELQAQINTIKGL